MSTISRRERGHHAVVRWIPLAFMVAACGSGSADGPEDAAAKADARADAPPDAAVDAPPDAAVDAPPDAAVDAPSDAAVDATRDAAVDAPPDAPPDAAVDAPPDATRPSQIAIAMTGEGDVALFQANALVGRCSASCALTVNPALPTTVYASTLGTFAGFDGVAAAPDQSGGIETLPAGATAVAVAFAKRPGERWIELGLDAAFDASGDLAVAQGGPSMFGAWQYASTDLYDPSGALTWSVAGAPGELSFDAAGHLYAISGTAGSDASGSYWQVSAVELSPAGAVLSSGARRVYESPGLWATVLPGGGVASASTSGSYSDPVTLSFYADALVTQTAAATGLPQGHVFCLGVDGDIAHVALGNGFYANTRVLAFALDGTPLGDDGGDWDWCGWGKNGSAGNAFYGYSESRGWVARSRNASVSNFDSWGPPLDHGVDWGSEWPFNAAGADAAGNLYFQESPPPRPSDDWGEHRDDPHGLRLREYVDDTGIAVAAVERDAVYAPLQAVASAYDYMHMGVTVYDLAVAPDGRIALTVAYVAAGADFIRPYVIVLPPL